MHLSVASKLTWWTIPRWGLLAFVYILTLPALAFLFFLDVVTVCFKGLLRLLSSQRGTSDDDEDSDEWLGRALDMERRVGRKVEDARRRMAEEVAEVKAELKAEIAEVKADVAELLALLRMEMANR